MSKTIQLSVNKIIFQITPKGHLFPLINFNSNKKLDKMGIDSIAMPSLSNVLNMKIGKGSRLRVRFEDEKKNFAPEIVEVMKIATRAPELPLFCPSCAKELVDTQNGHVSCVNLICSGQSRGMLYKMFKLIRVPLTDAEMCVFLDNYVIGESTNSIDNMEEFKLIFGQTKHKKTQARENNWVKQLPEIGSKLWEAELVIEDWLKSKNIPVSYFWGVCNFPMISEPEVNELNKINPSKLLNMEYDLKKLNLSNKVERYLTNNITFINFLHNFFISFGEKNWTN